ncbi:TetR/AcrR family transcriptional regulator [Rothia sp. ZJ932]|uniref:TetR/AcrR family transcriptional regulator n=1 Tax=Rothia sp. ZJ932 TaxID=2810516 RepID=UPI001966F1B2|nr:TetR/AcrR family transcriptional regulator [Rothia sp. ZJ932]QRZ61546.1 TetR/AcrR family transcriptional regulator [Rothia sp. ZJ932]
MKKISKTTKGNAHKAGRRAGESDTRNDILNAASTLFARHGFTGTSMRAIAAEANVDPALIRHFFTNKDSLFSVLVDSHANRAKDAITTLDLSDLSEAEAIIYTYLHLWNSDDFNPFLTGLLHSVTTPTDDAEQFKEIFWDVFTTGPLDNAARKIDPIAFALMSSQLLGLAVGRYLLKMPHMTVLSNERIIEELSPVIQQYIDGTYRSPSERTSMQRTPSTEHLSLTPDKGSDSHPPLQKDPEPSDIEEKDTRKPTIENEVLSLKEGTPDEAPQGLHTLTEDELLIAEEIPANTPSTPALLEDETQEPNFYTRPAVEGAHEPTLFEEEPAPTKNKQQKTSNDQEALFDTLF